MMAPCAAMGGEEDDLEFTNLPRTPKGLDVEEQDQGVKRASPSSREETLNNAEKTDLEPTEKTSTLLNKNLKFARLICMDRIAKNNKQLESIKAASEESDLRDQLLSFIEDQKSARALLTLGLERAGLEALVTLRGMVYPLILNDIAIYEDVLKIIDEIQKGPSELKEHTPENDLYAFLEYKAHFQLFQENDNFVTNPLAKESNFLTLLSKILYNRKLEFYGSSDDYLLFSETEGNYRYGFNSERFSEHRQKDLDPLLKHPLLKFAKKFTGAIEEKIKTVNERLSTILTERKRILLEHVSQGIRSVLLETSRISYPIQDTHKENIVMYQMLPKILKNLNESFDEFIPQINALAADLNQWIHLPDKKGKSNLGKINAPLTGGQRQELLDFLPKPAQEDASPKKSSAKKKEKKKTIHTEEAPPPQEEGKKAESPAQDTTFIPERKSPPQREAVIYTSFNPVELYERKTAKVKTKGIATISEKKEADSEEDTTPLQSLFVKGQYPEWIETLLHHNCPQFDKISSAFRKFLNENNIEGECFQNAAFLVSPVNGKAYAVTFHPPHRGSKESSWPSWRIELINLFKKAMIIEN